MSKYVTEATSSKLLETKQRLLWQKRLSNSLYKQTLNDQELNLQKVHLAIHEILSESEPESTFEPHSRLGSTPMSNTATQSPPNATEQTANPTKSSKMVSSISTPNGLITLRNDNQKEYITNIFKEAINFGIGPAGTGKTYLAVAAAVFALEQQQARRIVLVRPVVEAGERLGFLPGDLAQKIDPYLRPLYDALYEMIGFEKVSKLLEQQTIELAPLAYMRGRTLSDAFIILDESQNTTIEQMQMFLTRIGFGSTVVITGDITQIDLPNGKASGLRHAIDVLKGIEGIGFNYFTSKDVVRHNLVQKIIDAYGRSNNST